jgi:GntR family transcriptional regulator
MRFEKAIAAGEHPQGQMLRADDLAQQVQVPVAEMRRVLLAAWRKGLVEPAGQDPDLFRVLGVVRPAFSSVFTHTDKSGLRPRSELREVRVEQAGATVAAKLRVEAGGPVYRYVRTRYANDEALANQVNYMPYEVCPGLEEYDVSHRSFQKILEEEYYAIFSGMDESFILEPATEEDREILGLPDHTSVLVVDRVAKGATGWPLVWAMIRIRPDRYEYVAALWPEAAGLLHP